MSAPILRRLRPTDADRLLDADSGHEPWAIAVDDELVGLVAVTVDEENRSGWFWYWAATAVRGRGWAARAAATVAQWAFEVRGLERLELGHRVTNPASGGVARRAGFVVEGTEREKFLIDGQRIDVLTYGRLRSDPTPTTPLLPMQQDPSGTEPPDRRQPHRRPPTPTPHGVSRPFVLRYTQATSSASMISQVVHETAMYPQ